MDGGGGKGPFYVKMLTTEQIVKFRGRYEINLRYKQACLILILMLDSKVGRGNFCPLSTPCHEKMTGTLLVNLALHSFSEQGGSKQIPSIIRNFKQKSKCFIFYKTRITKTGWQPVCHLGLATFALFPERTLACNIKNID